MPGYETTVVLRPNASEEQTAAMRAKLETIVKGEGGEVLNYEDWGNRRLAFTRKRENKGHYHYFAFTGKVSTVAELERNLRINENVLLYLSVRRNAGESPEEITELKDLSAMLKARERSRREGFGAEGDMRPPRRDSFGEGMGGKGSPRDEGSKYSKE